MHVPYEEHLEAVYQIVRYLNSTPGKGLFFKNTNQRSTEILIDAGWVGSVTNSRSTARYCTSLWGNMVGKK